jgi:NADP-reducing hydrogenase subunit HndB
MTTIKSLDDLKKVRDEALAKRQVKSSTGAKQVIVAMGTCGIAAGARDTMKAILGVIEKDNLHDITVTQTGCIGLCEMEPIVEVIIGDQPKVTYGKVNKEMAERIVREHVVVGRVVSEAVIS